GRDDCRVIRVARPRNGVWQNIDAFAQVEEGKSGFRNRRKWDRSIQAGMKIFDNFRQKLNLVREIREFCYLRHGQSNFRQPANELVQMGRRNPASAIRDEFLQVHFHWKGRKATTPSDSLQSHSYSMPFHLGYRDVLSKLLRTSAAPI